MSATVAARISLARMIAQRLERMSADSAWTHISSGYRGALLKLLDRLDHLPDVEAAERQDVTSLDFLIDKGLDLLAKAARELGDPELTRFVNQSRQI